MNGHVRVTAAAVCAMLATGSVLPTATHAAGFAKRVTGVTVTAGTTSTVTTSAPPSAPSQGGGPGQGGPGGGSGGPGGFRGNGLLINGTITAVNAAAGTITITPANSSTSETIDITSSTKLVGHETIPASAVAVGDTLLITGIPTSVLATSIVDDKTASSSSTSTSSSSSTSSGSGGTTNTPPMMPVPTVVTALSPLTVEVNNEYSLTITTNSSTTLTGALTVTLSELAAGDTVSVQATESSSGTLTASRVDVTAAS